MNLLELWCQGFHIVPSLEPTLPHIMPTLISKIKNIKPPLNVSTKFVILGFFFFGYFFFGSRK
jgi:hypothetical protein